MKIIIEFADIKLFTPTAEIIEEWIAELVRDKSTDNTSPLRYADKITVTI